jgi:hypothetical protein
MVALLLCQAMVPCWKLVRRPLAELTTEPAAEGIAAWFLALAMRNDVLVTHRLLQTVRRLFGRRAGARAGRPTFVVERASLGAL